MFDIVGHLSAGQSVKHALGGVPRGPNYARKHRHFFTPKSGHAALTPKVGQARLCERNVWTPGDQEVRDFGLASHDLPFGSSCIQVGH